MRMETKRGTIFQNGRYIMSISKSVVTYIKQHGIHYTVLSHDKTRTLEETADSIHAPYAKMLRAVIMSDGEQQFMAVLPVTHVLNFKLLQSKLGRELSVASYRDFSDKFDCCERGSVPPIGEPFDLPVFIDQSVANLDEVYFEPGSHIAAMKMNGNDYIKLMGRNNVGDFAYPLTMLAEMDVSTIRYASPLDMKRRIEEIYELPSMPDIALRILDLSKDEDASIIELSDIVQADPSLAAQTLRYATSSLFGYRGKIDSIQDAIVRVLGFDMTMNMALGIAIGKSFRNPTEGPLGMDEFWRHSVACATLTQRLAKLMPAKNRPKTGMVYLSGLLHNFGFLLLGHLFQPEFYLLNKMAAANPDKPIIELEQQVLGMGRARDAIDMGHAQMGYWLMEAWGLPTAVCTTVREHHSENYEGENDVYVNLVKVANRLLKRVGIGDEGSEDIPQSLLDKLGLNEIDVVAELESLIEEELTEVEAMAHQIAA